ncbi:hypothetical protein CN311_24865 [Mesorhizobium sanjuanii]|uniref:Uncharacterized protein n=1 Tax=Mesorhizobium sanjuanii TaxID=2037900 RepID=A0A2A6F9V1_9HYPH|nr:hypothetical protein CN311_24865 [Mesorhizobium sanjuanii]
MAASTATLASGMSRCEVIEGLLELGLLDTALEPGLEGNKRFWMKGRPRAALKLPISPLVGEMSGRTEGGAKERQPGSIRDQAGALRIF